MDYVSHYFSASGLIWNGMFKITEMELEIIPDSDMIIFFEKGTRVGISYVSHRCSKANNNI